MTARDRTIVLVLVVVAVCAGFWFALLAPLREESSRLDAELVTQRERLRTAQETAAEAAQARARYEADYAAVLELGKAVPADDDLPSLLYQLETAAHGAKIDFRSIKRASGGDTASGAPSRAAAVASASGNAPSGAAAPAGSASAQADGSAAGATSAAAGAALPPGATVGAAGLATLPFSFGFRGSYFELERFLRDVQRFVVARGDAVTVRGRLLTVDGVSLVPSDKGLGQIEANVAATAYLQPAESAAGDAAGSGAGSGSADAGGQAAPAQTASASTPGAQ